MTVDEKIGQQAEEYDFPYHYLPVPAILESSPRLSRRWGFAASYLAALDIGIEWLLKEISIHSSCETWKHVDVGCGDGAFLYHLSRVPVSINLDLTGIDQDARAIDWAKNFSRSTEFICGDLSSIAGREFNSASLIEVLEHIPPPKIEGFLSQIAGILHSDARMIVTVPSVEKKLEQKHFQHFDFCQIKEIFEKNFRILEISAFERVPLISRVLDKIYNKYGIFIDAPFLTNFIIKKMRKKYSNISNCGRILIIVEKKL
ncbi:MAG: methyltransferase domain-containing protein [Marinovum algicola]